MGDYLLWWELSPGVGPRSKTMRVKMTPTQVAQTDEILKGLVDDGAIQGYFIETVPERPATFEQFVKRAGEPLSRALEFGV